MANRNLSFEALSLIADRFKVLSEPLRLQILHLLQGGEKSVNELTEAVGTSQPNISKHLKLLQNNLILQRRQDGNTVYYSIADESIFTLCETVCGSLEEQLKSRADIFAV